MAKEKLMLTQVLSLSLHLHDMFSFWKGRQTSLPTYSETHIHIIIEYFGYINTEQIILQKQG